MIDVSSVEMVSAGLNAFSGETFFARRVISSADPSTANKTCEAAMISFMDAALSLSSLLVVSSSVLSPAVVNSEVAVTLQVIVVISLVSTTVVSCIPTPLIDSRRSGVERFFIGTVPLSSANTSSEAAVTLHVDVVISFSLMAVVSPPATPSVNSQRSSEGSFSTGRVAFSS